MSDKQYGHYEQGVDSEFYSVHVGQMTAEKLHGKREIAAELAYRDQRIAELEAKVQQLEAAQRRKAASETLSDTGQVVAFGDQIEVRVTDDDELFAVKNALVTRYKSGGDLRRAVLSIQGDTAPPPPEVEE